MTTNLFDITTPAFGGKPVRTVTGNGETWFCAMDVFNALGLDDGGTHASSYVKKYGIAVDESRVLTKKLLNRPDGAISASFPNRGLIFVNATAVRRIAQRSSTTAAKQFQTFMNKTVAGAIEKDGVRTCTKLAFFASMHTRAPPFASAFLCSVHSRSCLRLWHCQLARSASSQWD